MKIYIYFTGYYKQPENRSGWNKIFHTLNNTPVQLKSSGKFCFGLFLKLLLQITTKFTKRIYFSTYMDIAVFVPPYTITHLFTLRQRTIFREKLPEHSFVPVHQKHAYSLLCD